MKRRLWLKRVELGAVAGLLTQTLVRRLPTQSSDGAAPSVLNQQWRMATRWPKSLDLIYSAADRFCQRVNRMTQGLFVITPFEAGEIFPAKGFWAAVTEDTVECGHTTSVDDLGR